jgi:peptidoglycan-associated lipoprotein
MMNRWIVFALLLGSLGCGPGRGRGRIEPLAGRSQPVATAVTPVVNAGSTPAAPVAAVVTPVIAEPPVSEVGEPRVDLPALMAEMETRLRDALFSYDRFEVSAGAAAALEHNAGVLQPLLKRFPNVRVTVEGHCDERGSDAYNLALGDQRARRAVEFLQQLALDPARFDVISYGREMPQCSEPNESCWQRNRRAHFKLK